MKDLHLGLDRIDCPEADRHAFFGQLLPAHAESLKGQPLSTLEHNLLERRLDGALATPVPQAADLPVTSPAQAATLQALAGQVVFTPAEARAVGLIDDAAVDWSQAVDIDLSAESEVTAKDIDIAGLPTPEPVEPTRGKSLAQHVQIGFAYEMMLQGDWQQVRLSHVSPGRSFFVFTHGAKQRGALTMTHRMLVKLCEGGRLRALEAAYLLERATARARRQLASLSPKKKYPGRPGATGSRQGHARASRRAMRNAAIRLLGSARPVPAMSNAVPWSGLVRTNGSPSVTLTPCSTPRYLTGIRPWS